MAAIKVEVIEVNSSDEEEKDMKNINERTYDKAFPKTLEEFGYTFQGETLKNIVTGEPFNFMSDPNDNVYNQRRYEAMGELITDYVYNLLEKHGMKKLAIPIDAGEDEPFTHVYHSPNAFQGDTLIILIHGSGVVRAGQWSRRLIINDSIRSGSQIPFMKRAMGLGFGVLVLNTNDNSRVKNGHVYEIRGSESAERHANYVWRKLVAKSAIKHVGIVAHSYGGVVAVNLCKSFPEAFQERVFGIAFTDSAHSLIAQHIPIPDIQFLRKISRNWVSSHEPLDTPLVRDNESDVDCFSAGTQRHDLTSWMAFTSVYSFLDNRLRLKVLPNYFAHPVACVK